jgi:hypothetical protein
MSLEKVGSIADAATKPHHGERQPSYTTVPMDKSFNKLNAPGARYAAGDLEMPSGPNTEILCFQGVF